jgi:hypothetical protein
MKQSIRRAQCLILPGWLLFTLLVVTVIDQDQSAYAAQTNRQQSDIAMIHHVITGGTEQAPDYWTDERMKNAYPIDTDHAQTQSNTLKSQVVGNASGLYSGQAQRVAASNYNKFPYSAEGKVFFTDGQTGNDYVCSGTAVISANKSVVDTAGHCVIEGGSQTNYYTNWMFCPQRLNGQCPKGQWFARELYASPEWASNMTISRDIGFAVVEKHGNKALDDVVQPVQIATNLPYGQTYKALGYPEKAPFDGEHMDSCQSMTVNTDSKQGTPKTVAIACTLTGGASGGGWLVQSNNSWYLNGHTSYGYDDLPGVLFSPHYDSYVRSIYNKAQAA